ncbi:MULTISPECIES: hypothetical protein [Rhodanobacter]|uniref:hypothetical protein n=1 Tax=Rhodanobacter TaxID=75309 RepID=UPI0012066833|nr:MULTISPECIES: hypothetical protein [Rhodanobacter]TAN17144.1 MAG: hypothetical protein EPN35_08025 [Rhodanobacter sp.]UJJ53728.1 hypothetical protein LRK53_12190 [Rhodanobacter thiooxydans]
MPKIKFEERAVAFVDVLGFGKIVESAVVDIAIHQQLQDLICLLEGTVPALDELVSRKVPRRLFPSHMYVSDCIILSAPITDFEHEFPSYDGLAAVTMRAIQLSHRFATEGYLLRGGIDVGKVWHTPSNIVGEAYQNAYKLETTTKLPRIELTAAAAKRWHTYSARRAGRMCIEYDGVLMVNGLHEYYAGLETGRDVATAYSEYAVTAAYKAKDSSLGPCAQAKWKWFKDFVESERELTGH